MVRARVLDAVERADPGSQQAPREHGTGHEPADVVAGGYYTTEIYMNEISDGVYVVNLVTDRETLSFKTMKY